MQHIASPTHPLSQPLFIKNAQELHAHLATLNVEQLSQVMHVSKNLAKNICAQISRWNTDSSQQSIAIDSFRGDIFSGLRATSLTDKDRAYANKHLVFLSGLYGLIRPFDGIMPYRLEMGYRLYGFKTPSLYDYWGQHIADAVKGEIILNLSSVEYAKVLTKYIDKDQIFSPRFLTLNPTTKSYKNIAVHSKIARGAFARWAIQQRINDPKDLVSFQDLGYSYNKPLSTEHEPTFTCETFQGLGLSIRTKN